MADSETEKEQAAESAAAESEPHGGEPEELPLPPPTFEFLLREIDLTARMSLGLLHFGEEKDRPKPNLRAARHSIDLLAMLLDKTRGNLDLDEKRLLENSLTELRFRYVQVVEETRAK